MQVLLLPMLADGVRDFREPRSVCDEFQNFHRREIFDASRHGIPERLEQAGGDQDGPVVQLAIQQPRGLFHLRTSVGGYLPKSVTSEV